MTDKMSKEEARAVLNDFLSSTHLELVATVKSDVLKIVESIEPDHEKVVLPHVAGKWVDQCKCIGKPSALFAGGSMPIDAYNWLFAKDIYTNTVREELLMKAYFNGWVPKSEKLYRVKVYGIDLPALFYRKCDDGTLSFVQGGAGMPETEFTMGEIKQHHLENCEREEVKGHAVEKDKKYNVKVPHTKDVWYYKAGKEYLLTICPADKKLRGKFTEAEIEHYGLQDCDKEEVTDDGTK